MNQNLIFIPVILQIMLTLAIYIQLAVAKSQATKAGLVREDRRALHDDAWPDKVLQINNNIRNQFEAPVLFYTLALLLWSIHAVTLSTLLLAAGFVASRLAHAIVHTGSNYVPLRRRLFMSGVLMILAMTIIAMIQIIRQV